MSPETIADAASKLFRDLRLRHQALMVRNLTLPAPAPEIESFARELIDAGASMPAGRDRDRLRNMLFFWTAELSSRTSAATPEKSLTRKTEESGEPARALPELKPYRGDGEAAQTSLSPDKPLRPSALAERELSEEELAELVKTRATLRIAALARQYKSTSGLQRKGYLLFGAALEEARSVIDRDPDIATLVEDSDKEVQRDRRRRRRAKSFVVALVSTIAALIGYNWYIEETTQKEILNEQNAMLKTERTQRYKELRGALDSIERGDPEPLRKFVDTWGDADASEKASILARAKAASPSPDVIKQLQSAVDALTAGDAKPVIELSREIAVRGANNKRVEVEQAAKAPRPNVLAPTKARPPALDAPVGKDAPSCVGWVWIGSDENRKVSGDGALASLKPGDRVAITANDDLRLRASPPESDYAMGEAIGVVAVGSEVVVVGAPHDYLRPNGLTQYWAEVKTARPFCTRVSIQYVGAELDRLSHFRDAVITKGYYVPAPEQVATAKGKAEVRYYHIEDEAGAEAVASELSRLTAGRKISARRLDGDATSGTIEAWIDLDLIR